MLAYHLIGAGTASPVDISKETFRAHVERLSRSAEVVPLEAAYRPAGASSGKPERPRVALTFDDAYENFFAEAYPLLEAHRMPATLYVPTGFVEGTARAPIRGTDGLRPCSWAQLREMHAGGLVALGSHTCTHPDLDKVSRTRAAWEVEASKSVIEEKIGTRVTSFCYPRGLWTKSVEEAVARHYESAVIGGGVAARPGRTNPLRIRRVPLTRMTPRDLMPILESRVWLEEWIANQVRRRRG